MVTREVADHDSASMGDSNQLPAREVDSVAKLRGCRRAEAHVSKHCSTRDFGCRFRMRHDLLYMHTACPVSAA